MSVSDSENSSRTNWERLERMTDDEIDTSDIPELTPEQMRRAVRGLMYRPMKRPVTMRLDADVIAWLKKDGRGYQTKANRLLREQMLRSARSKPSSNSKQWSASSPVWR